MYYKFSNNTVLIMLNAINYTKATLLSGGFESKLNFVFFLSDRPRTQGSSKATKTSSKSFLMLSIHAKVNEETTVNVLFSKPGK